MMTRFRLRQPEAVLMRASTGLCFQKVSFGLAESREKSPQSDRIKVGPDSYVGPDYLSLGVPTGEVKESMRLA